MEILKHTYAHRDAQAERERERVTRTSEWLNITERRRSHCVRTCVVEGVLAGVDEDRFMPPGVEEGVPREVDAAADAALRGVGFDGDAAGDGAGELRCAFTAS
jgi:hypothetical protein